MYCCMQRSGEIRYVPPDLPQESAQGLRDGMGSICCGRHDVWAKDGTDNISTNYNGNIRRIYSSLHAGVS